MAVDSGILYSSQTAAQRAADAAALAGAYTFVLNASAPQPATAQDRATSTAVTNKILQATVTSGEVSVSVDIPNRRVTVDITHVEPTYFSKALGFRQVSIHVQAVAEAAASATGSSCVKPWFMPNTITANQNPCTACSNGDYLIDSSGNITDYGTSQLGQQFTVRPTNPDAALGPGDYYSIQFANDPSQDATPGTSGGNAYRNNIAFCQPAAVAYCGNQYQVKTGTMVGPTQQGVECLLTLCTDPANQNSGTVTADTWDSFTNGIARYRKGGDASVLSDSSHQVINVPIWDACNSGVFNCTPGSGQNKLNGTNVYVTVVGFASVFIDGWQGNAVVGHLVGLSGCQGLPGGGQTGPGGYPLRLVRTS
jgi:hypothetical protein